MAADSFDVYANDAAAAERAVGLLKSLSHVGRLRILCALLDRPLSVSGLCDVVAEPQASVSQQLMRLRAEGLVARRRQGRTIEYRVERDDVRQVISSLREVFCSPPAKVKALHTRSDGSEGPSAGL